MRLGFQIQNAQSGTFVKWGPHSVQTTNTPQGRKGELRENGLRLFRGVCVCVCVCVNAVTHNAYSMRSLKVKKLTFGCTMIGIVKEYFLKNR